MRLLDPDAGELRASSSVSTARAILEAARCGGEAVDHRAEVLDRLDTGDDVLHRSSRPGHLTGSGLVVDAVGERFVLVHHAKLRIWVQPGGHADGEANLARVALDECTEETGIEGLRVAGPAIDVDIHRVAPPCDDPHLHYDVRFLVVAPPGAALVLNHESMAGRWVTWDEAGVAPIDQGTRRLAAMGRAAIEEIRESDGPGRPLS